MGMNLGKVVSAVSIGMGGIVGYRALNERKQASEADKAGNEHTAKGLNSKWGYDAAAAVSFLAAGAIGFITRGKEVTGGLEMARKASTLLWAGGFTGAIAAGTHVKDGRAADAEIAKLRETQQGPPSHKTPKQSPKQPQWQSSPLPSPRQQSPSQRPPLPFDDLPVVAYR